MTSDPMGVAKPSRSMNAQDCGPNRPLGEPVVAPQPCPRCDGQGYREGLTDRGDGSTSWESETCDCTEGR